ncbi:hypothetical protein [Thiohalocapsa marina]|uniref:hypothetical protein n=1 Tax=Thiohalocapsa marina TaxID=424902 RepID=UPI0036D9391C
MSEAAAFDALVEEFFSVWFRFHPLAAVHSGRGTAGSLLPLHTDDDQAALAGWLETLIVALEELDFNALDQDRQLDLELLFALATVEHRELLERDWRHRDPARFLPLAAIHRLTLLRPPDLRAALGTLLADLPDYLLQAMAQLRPMAALVSPVLARAAMAAAEDGRLYLRALGNSRWLKDQCGTGCALAAQAEIAGEALAHYADAIRHDLLPQAVGSAACGAAHLRLRLQRRHQLDLDPMTCAPWLDDLAQQCEQTDPAPAAGQSHTQASRLRDALGAENRGWLAHLRQRGLFHLPAAPLHVAGGPVCPRSAGHTIDYVANPAKAEGWLYVPDTLNGCAVPPTPGEVRARALHLGWGGTHALAFSGGDAARSLPRRHADGHSLSGGWSLYLDRLLFETADARPDDRAAALQRRRLAVALARIDLELHCDIIDADKAAHRLQRFMPDTDRALRQLARLIQQPGEALAAVLGWRLIEAAADSRADDSALSPRQLHDGLLGQGPIPLPLAMRRAFGDAHWKRIFERLQPTPT